MCPHRIPTGAEARGPLEVTGGFDENSTKMTNCFLFAITYSLLITILFLYYYAVLICARSLFYKVLCSL